MSSSPASAADTYVHRFCAHTAHYFTSQGYEQWVNLCWGFDYRPTYVLRGYARLVAQGTASANVVLQVRPLVLGDGNHASIAEGGGNSTAVLDIDTSTGGVNNEGWTMCSTQNPDAWYRSQMSFSVRYVDGQNVEYSTFPYDEWANGAGGTCTPYTVTYNLSNIIYPSSFGG
jgi:hypothetical protein